MKKGIVQLIICLLCSLPQALLAQENDPDFFRSTGKIYVVVAVIAAVFIGIVLFLVYLDRKLTKLEKQIEEHDQA